MLNLPQRAKPAGTLAAVWSRPADLARDGVVGSPVVWAALDCPSGFATGAAGRVLLAAMTATVPGDVHPDRPYVVAAWPVGRDGRKYRARSALYAAGGEPVAVADALWIEIADPSTFGISVPTG